MFWKKEKKAELQDNHDKECHPLNQRAEDGGWSYVGTCSLCGGRIGLWPYCEKKCSNCLATIIHQKTIRLAKEQFYEELI